MSPRARSLFAVAVAAASMICAAPAGAAAGDTLDSPALHAVVTSDAATITPSTRRITGDIALTAGSKRIAVTVEATSPVFSNSVLGRYVNFGPTLRPMHMRALTPAPDYLFIGEGGSSGSPCGGFGPGPAFAWGGDQVTTLERALLLKPRQTVRLSTSFDVAGDAPWWGSDYSPTYKLKRVSADVGDGTRLRPVGVRTLKKSVTLHGAAPALSEPFAARIDISALAGPTAGAPSKIAGNLVPGLEGRTVSFLASYIPSGTYLPEAPQAIGSAVTGPNGSFSFDGWTPAPKGAYAIYPRYESQAGGLLPSTMCPFFYSKKTGFVAGP